MLTTFDPWRTGAAVAEVSMAACASPGQFESRRARRLADLFRSAAQGSSHYREVFAGCDPARSRLSDLPVAHKAELMHRFADWVTDPAIDLTALRRFISDPAHIGQDWLGRYTVWESSGSTGEPGVFVQDGDTFATLDTTGFAQQGQGLLALSQGIAAAAPKRGAQTPAGAGRSRRRASRFVAGPAGQGSLRS